MVDRRFSNCHSREFLSYDMGGIPHRYAPSPLLSVPSIHVKAGQLFLGVFSGPVEGIIMICGLYVVTGFKGKLIISVNYSPLLSSLIGPTFWDQKILAVTGLDKVDLVARYIPDIGLNDSFMVFGTFGLAFNILTRSYHIHRCTLTKEILTR